MMGLKEIREANRKAVYGPCMDMHTMDQMMDDADRDLVLAIAQDARYAVKRKAEYEAGQRPQDDIPAE